MTFLWRFRWRRRREVASAAAAAFASAALACGPDFPNRYFTQSAAALLAAPEGIFAEEIQRITGAKQPVESDAGAEHLAGASTASVDVAELREALIERGFSMARVDATAAAYAKARLDLDGGNRRAALARSPGTSDVGVATPPDLPPEFADYFAGGVAWHEGDWRAARVCWMRVLERPAGERGYRSTWAAFMIGRTWIREAEAGGDRAVCAAGAVRAFQRTRELAAAGFRDGLGLAAASTGWEGRAALLAQDFVKAIELYLVQFVEGEKTALDSLRIAASQASKGGEATLAKLAAASRARQVVTAYLISRGNRRPWGAQEHDAFAQGAENWATALRAAGVREEPEADRMAWLAYTAGMFSLARDWIELARADVPEAQWLRAKLALRGGDLARGRTLLRDAMASPALCDLHRMSVAGELARVCLAQDDLAGALDASLTSGVWEDAAYVAERVMTTAELRAYVDAQAPGDRAGRLSHLLARRLARANARAAADYFSSELQPLFRGYLADCAEAFDTTRPAEERAAAFWRAAQCARKHGLELFGSELEPDWASWEGNYALIPTREVRLEMEKMPGGLFGPTELEQQRLKAQPAPQQRFHYRYRAADLAWWAASLLPNDDERTAQILHAAGGWLKARDPQGAQRFYRALVIRCGNTSLGREAAERRWFPAAAPEVDGSEI